MRFMSRWGVSRPTRVDAIALLLLTAVLVLVYWQVTGFGFTYDDDVYVTAVPAVQTGITWEGVRWAFTTTHAEFWHPLTWISLMLDRQIFGAGASGFHLSALLLHLANTILIYLLVRRLIGYQAVGFFTAALFALHPLHAQNVAWIADRKDLLSALFCFLFIAYYRSYAARPGARRYLLATAMFALGLMAKPSLVMLPVMLLLIDWWPLGRLRRGPGGTALLSLLLEKIPLVLLSLGAALVGYWAQARADGVAPLAAFSLRARLTNAVVSYAEYLRMTIWPSGQATFYPHPHESIPIWTALAALLLLVVITILTLSHIRQRPHLAVGWIWFGAMLFPVIGLIQVGNHAMADRYTYVPHVGLFLGIVWEVTLHTRRNPVVVHWAIVIALCALAALSIATWQHTGYYRNSVVLFRRAYAVTSDNWFVRVNLGISLLKQSSYAEAETHFRAMLRMDPFSPLGHHQLAIALGYQGRLKEAEDHARESIRLSPRNAPFLNVLVWILLRSRQGSLNEIEDLCRSAIALDPTYVDPHINLAVILVKQSRLDDARMELKEALRLDPGNRVAQENLARIRGIGLLN